MTEPYRDETSTIEEKLRQIDQELSHIDAANARRRALQREAAELQRRLDEARNKSPLGAIRIASPCSARWDDMVGDNRVRHCGACNKDVFNLSGMTRAEATQLVTNQPGKELCLRMYKRPDGTVMTADCPVGMRRKRVRRLAVLGAGVAASLAGGLLYAWVEPASTSHFAGRDGNVMGEAAMPYDQQHHVTGTTAEPHTVGTAIAIQPPAPETTTSAQAPSKTAPVKRAR